jgi:homoserine kinase type II
MTPRSVDGVHRLWWKRMSHFWHLDFHYDRGDNGCDDLFVSGEALLHWWTSNSMAASASASGSG